MPADTTEFYIAFESGSRYVKNTNGCVCVMGPYLVANLQQQRFGVEDWSKRNTRYSAAHLNCFPRHSKTGALAMHDYVGLQSAAWLGEFNIDEFAVHVGQ